MISNFKKNEVKKAFENPTVVDCYADKNYDKGLWNSERILIQRYFPANGYCLDIGCGAGRTPIALAQMGYKVLGIDLSSAMLRAARRKASENNLNIEFVEMDACNLSFADQSFDCAFFSFNGIDYIPGYDAKLDALKEIFRVLRPGANFIFSTHRILNFFHVKKLLLSTFKMSIARIMGSNTFEKEWGELYDIHAPGDERYWHFMSVSRWKNAIGKAGFSLLLNSPMYRIESRRTLGWIRRSLRSSNFMFYVANKP